MSIWTHIAGCIRFDALRMPGMPDQNPKNWMGNTVEFDDDVPKWDACTVPRGSEGSLQYLVDEEKGTNSLAAYRVLIWGDLRDYDNVDEVRAWLERITKGKMVRQLVVEVEVEGRDPVYFGMSDQKLTSHVGKLDSPPTRVE